MDLRIIRTGSILSPLHTTRVLFRSIAHRQSINSEIEKLRTRGVTHDEENACRRLYALSEPRHWRTLTRAFSSIVQIARHRKNLPIDRFKMLTDNAYKHCCSKDIDSEFTYAGV